MRDTYLEIMDIVGKSKPECLLSSVIRKLQKKDCKRIGQQLSSNLAIEDRKYRLRTFKQCFIGFEAAKTMEDMGLVCNRRHAELLGNQLLNYGIILHVTHAHPFLNEFFFYRLPNGKE